MKQYLRIKFSVMLLLFSITYVNAQWSELGGTNSLNAGGNIQALLSDASNNIYACGNFSNPSSKRYVAKWDGTQWGEIGGSNSLNAGGIIFAMCKDQSGNIYATGGFKNASNAYYVAKFDGTSWSEVGSNLLTSTSLNLNALCCDNQGNLYAAGFLQNSSSKYYVAKWNGSTWSELGGNNSLAANSNIYSLVADANGNIYAAGAFKNASNKCYVAKFNGTGWSELGGTNTSTFGDVIRSMCLDVNGNILVAGQFRNASNNRYVAKFDGTGWSELGGNNSLAANDWCYTVCSDVNGNVYTGGEFKNASNKNYVAKFNGTGWSELGGNNSLAANGYIKTLCSDAAGNVYAGGSFQNGSPKFYVAKFSNAPVCNPTSSTTNTTICSNELPYTWNGLTFNSAGSQTKTGLINAGGCDSVATLNLTVNILSGASVVVSAGANNVCQGTIVNFSATPGNGGTNPTYQWMKNGNNVGANSNTYTDINLNNNDSVWCVLTSNSTCISGSTAANSNAIKMIIKPGPAIGISYLTKILLCSIGTTSIANNTNTLGGGIWTSSNTNVVTIVTNSSAAAGTATAQGNGSAILTYTKTSSANGCTASANVEITVATVTTPSLISPPVKLCKGNSVTLNASISGGTWASLNSSATVTSGGVATATANAGSTYITYTIIDANGCSSVVNLLVPVYAQPAIPGISYASGSINPQTGAVPSSAYCNNRTFTLVGNPAGGSWSSTNSAVVTVNSAGVAQTIGVGSGSVVYTVTNVNGCTNSKSIIGSVVACVTRGVNLNQPVHQLTNQPFTLYPNPARQLVSLNINQLIGSGTIVITDLYGKQVKQQALSIGRNTIDISSLSKGMYLVSIITSDGKKTEKLVVE